MSPEAFSDGLLGWIIRIAGLFWLLGAFALLRQIRMEMTLDRLSAQIEGLARDAPEGDHGAQPQRTSEEEAEARWTEDSLDDPQIAYNKMTVTLEDPRRGAVMGYSFGGYYAARVAAFEKRSKTQKRSRKVFLSQKSAALSVEECCEQLSKRFSALKSNTPTEFLLHPQCWLLTI